MSIFYLKENFTLKNKVYLSLSLESVSDYIIYLKFIKFIFFVNANKEDIKITIRAFVYFLITSVMIIKYGISYMYIANKI